VLLGCARAAPEQSPTSHSRHFDFASGGRCRAGFPGVRRRSPDRGAIPRPAAGNTPRSAHRARARPARERPPVRSYRTPDQPLPRDAVEPTRIPVPLSGGEDKRQVPWTASLGEAPRECHQKLLRNRHPDESPNSHRVTVENQTDGGIGCDDLRAEPSRHGAMLAPSARPLVADRAGPVSSLTAAGRCLADGNLPDPPRNGCGAA